MAAIAGLDGSKRQYEYMMTVLFYRVHIYVYMYVCEMKEYWRIHTFHLKSRFCCWVIVFVLVIVLVHILLFFFLNRESKMYTKCMKLKFG